MYLMSLYAFKLGLRNHMGVGEENNLFGTREINFLQTRLCLPLCTCTGSLSAPHRTAVRQVDVTGLSS